MCKTAQNGQAIHKIVDTGRNGGNNTQNIAHRSTKHTSSEQVSCVITDFPNYWYFFLQNWPIKWFSLPRVKLH